MAASSMLSFLRQLTLGALLGASAVPLSAQGAPARTVAPADESRSGRVILGDRTIEADEVLDEIVVVGGDLRIRGRVRGDASVIGGDLILEESGSVEGNARVTGGRLLERGGRVQGEMRTLDGGADLAAEIERAIAGGSTDAARAGSDRGRSRAERQAARTRFWSDPVRRGMAGMISTTAFGLVLAGIGAGLIFFARSPLEVVSATIRSAPLRSAATGLAATFLMVPTFVVLIVALAVSIIGIPVLLIAIPLYPLALFGASLFGLIGVAHAVGERMAEQSRDALEVRYGGTYGSLFTGLGLVLAPLLASYLLQMTGFLGIIGVLLKVVTWSAIWLAGTIGLGAVILSRAGTRAGFTAPAGDAAVDDLLDDELFSMERHA